MRPKKRFSAPESKDQLQSFGSTQTSENLMIQPLRERAKLDSVEQIHREIKKLYRRFTNNQISAYDLKNRVNTLAVLRAGLADKLEEPADFTPLIINILAVPSGFFLSESQIAAARIGAPSIDTAQLEPLLLDQTNEPAAGQTNKPVELERWRERDKHFRPDFKLGDVGDIA